VQEITNNRRDNGLDDRGLLGALLGDGRPLLLLSGLALVLAGGFALFLSASKHFLPHDVDYLGMTAEQLCGINNCRVVYFMFHDRVAFGGALIAIGVLYMWLAEFPLRRREAWAWWAFVVSGIFGFGSFLAYLGYGYLDTWHGAATLLILPCFVIGLAKSRAYLEAPRGIGSLSRPGASVSWLSPLGMGRALLLAVAGGMIAGGLTVMTFGMTRVFVPQDLIFMGLTRSDLQTISARLIPLIAHDRAGFGGAICTTGVTVLLCVWCARPSRNLWQILCLAGVIGFAAAIGVHPIVGYNDLFHLAPAILGAIMFVAGLILCWRPMRLP
jgi:MFS family permease